MPKKHINVNVVKVPLKYPTSNHPQIFPRMPRLYLELIENKGKIKQDFINKEYIPSESYKPITPEPQNNQQLDTVEDDNISLAGSSVNTVSRVSSPGSVSSVASASTHNDLDRSNEELPASPDKPVLQDTISSRMKELLNDHDGDTSEDTPKDTPKDKYSRQRDINGHGMNGKTPPTLSELERNGGYVPRREYRDINHTPFDEQKQEDDKRELLFKFDLLRKSYPLANIPDFTIHTDIGTLQKAYEDNVRRLSLDSSVENYKTYLIYGFMGCEFVFGNFLGFDMQGFTQQQILSMNSYDKLLIELGEKSYIPEGSSWPVEIRLLFMIIMNAAFFIVSKMIMNKTGANLMGMMNSFNSSGNQAPNRRKRKMKGPSVNIDDIADIK